MPFRIPMKLKKQLLQRYECHQQMSNFLVALHYLTLSSHGSYINICILYYFLSEILSIVFSIRKENVSHIVKDITTQI